MVGSGGRDILVVHRARPGIHSFVVPTDFRPYRELMTALRSGCSG
jgi:hypothetical protein